MNKKEQNLLDLQEILLWQELNKQLIELKESGSPLGDHHHKYLRDFSLDKMLFSRITKEFLLDEVPLALITDLSKRCFITLKLDVWNNCLAELLPNTYILNIEKAQAGAFDTLDELSSRYDLIDADDDESEHDEELFDYIGKYMDTRESDGRNFLSLVSELHRLKSLALTKIMEVVSLRCFLREEEDMLFLDLRDCKEKEVIASILDIYENSYRRPAASIVDPINRFPNVPESQIMLYGKEKGEVEDPKESISSFKKHEKEIFQKETKIFGNFYKNKNQQEASIINICSTAPFFFIDNPLPLY